MPDIPNRDELERKYARIIAKLLRVQMGRLLELMGDPPRLENVPVEFWADHAKEMQDALIPFGERVYMDAAERMLAEIPIGVDWALVNEAAINWAETYTYNLVSGINETSRRAISRAVSQFFRGDLNMGQLRDRLGRIYSPVRADMIAQTEVTRASVEGERALVREVEKYGIRMVPIWQTSNDELVCPICSPRHGKPITNEEYPPAHPRCRCWVNHELARVTA